MIWLRILAKIGRLVIDSHGILIRIQARQIGLPLDRLLLCRERLLSRHGLCLVLVRHLLAAHKLDAASLSNTSWRHLIGAAHQRARGASCATDIVVVVVVVRPHHCGWLVRTVGHGTRLAGIVANLNLRLLVLEIVLELEILLLLYVGARLLACETVVLVKSLLHLLSLLLHLDLLLAAILLVILLLLLKVHLLLLSLLLLLLVSLQSQSLARL